MIMINDKVDKIENDLMVKNPDLLTYQQDAYHIYQ